MQSQMLHQSPQQRHALQMQMQMQMVLQQQALHEQQRLLLELRPYFPAGPPHPLILPPGTAHLRPGPAEPAPPPRPTFLPPINTFLPRIKLAETSLMQPAVEKKRKRRFAEESTDDEDDDDDDDDSDLDGQDDLDADGKGRRKSRRAAGPAMRRSDRASANVAAVAAAVAASNGAQDTASSLGSEVPSRIVIATNRPKPLRLLRETEHAYEQILLCKHDMFASVKEVLVPVKLEFELDGMRVRDTITWNLNDVLVTPVMFARYLQQDLELSDEQTHRIAGMIAVQLEEHRRFFEMFDVPAPEDTRVLIKLNIRSGKVLLRDRFEWDLSSGLTPEEFARHMVMDLRLGGEFVQLIAWSIRDQLHRIRRDGEFEPTFAIEQPFRAEEEARSWSPRVEITLAQSEDEEEEVDMAKERASRRIRREQRTNATSRRRPAYPGVADAASYSAAAAIAAAGAAAAAAAAGNPAERDPALGAADPTVDWKCAHCECRHTVPGGMRPGVGSIGALCNSCSIYLETTGELPEHRYRMFREIRIK